MRFSKVQVNHANFVANQKKDNLARKALAFLQDDQREKRLERCLCPSCMYLDIPKIVMHSFTKWDCQACETAQPAHPNSGVPMLCLACAEKYGLCRECLADLDLRPRTKVTRSNKFRRKRSSRG